MYGAVPQDQPDELFVTWCWPDITLEFFMLLCHLSVAIVDLSGNLAKEFVIRELKMLQHFMRCSD